jgi:hypothetical protein
MSMSCGGAAEAMGGAAAVLLFGMRRRILLNAGRRQQSRALRAGALAAVLGILLLAGARAESEDGAWRDIESRIQYGYYTEDAAALRHLAESLASDESHDKLHGYYAGLTDWRLALLGARANPALPASSPAKLSQQCVSQVDTALAVQADFADALALRAACLAAPLEASGAHAPFALHRARKDLDRALQLAAANPRVLLVDAMSDYELSGEKGGNKERALAKLRQAVAAFEAERTGAEPLPGWGAAEAWFLLARDLFDHGDPVGARDALEHALLIAPEFAQARRLMAKVTAG